MLSHPTQIAYPAVDPIETQRWAFDIVKPKGTPYAWVQDWSAATAGFCVPAERMDQLSSFDVADDLSELTTDDIAGVRGRKLAVYLEGLLRTILDELEPEASQHVLKTWAFNVGSAVWDSVIKSFGTDRPPLSKLAWIQDLGHLFYGPPASGYTWFDEEKQVLVRTLDSGIFGVPAKQSMLATEPALAGALGDWPAGYMSKQPELLCTGIVTPANDPLGKRMIHLWTYEASVIESLPDYMKDNISGRVRDMMRSRGVKL